MTLWVFAEFSVSRFALASTVTAKNYTKSSKIPSNKVLFLQLQVLGGHPTSFPFPNKMSLLLFCTLCSQRWLLHWVLFFHRPSFQDLKLGKNLLSCRNTFSMKPDAYFLPSIFHTPGFTSEDCNETSTLSRCLWTTAVLSMAVEQPLL